MPAKHFICSDNQEIEISKCLEKNGCRMTQRCAALPYLRLIGYDREWNGVTPSASGNGPRILYLKAVTDYSINPNDRVWASIGTGTHGKLSIHKYTSNVLSEEKLTDELIKGIPDVLELDEEQPHPFEDRHILYDYKTWGSFKVAKALGLTIEKKTEPILDDDGNPVLFSSGKNKGKPKTKTISNFVIKPETIDLKAEEFQLNRYRILFESYGFMISKMIIQAIPRDGGTYVAKNRGIDCNLYLIPIKRIDNDLVMDYYDELQGAVDTAFELKYSRLCDKWESWDYRRCDGYCEVSEACKKMSEANNEKWDRG